MVSSFYRAEIDMVTRSGGWFGVSLRLGMVGDFCMLTLRARKVAERENEKKWQLDRVGANYPKSPPIPNLAVDSRF